MTNLFIIGRMYKTRLAVPEVQRHQSDRDQISQIFIVTHASFQWEKPEYSYKIRVKTYGWRSLGSSSGS